MKRVILLLLSWVFMFASASAIEFRPWDKTILTEKMEDVVSDDISSSDDAINAGIDAIWWGNIKGIYGDDIENNATAWEKATNLMKWLINYALGLIWLIALWYLIVNGFILLTAGNDEERSKRWIKGVRIAVVAIAGIALSWFILSLIFFLIFSVTDGLG